ncbi:uncharacterized protein LOC126859271 [Cataglyphis hispanica]|uniref:uncharacterized protein LOC126859271 n=1 Tax=Cataglyphis hispanica TaxID=1086592 RepID=UPI00217FCB88|nr:uncharacterized protein LOC126859271 [Cataglyphis hispanica]
MEEAKTAVRLPATNFRRISRRRRFAKRVHIRAAESCAQFVNAPALTRFDYANPRVRRIHNGEKTREIKMRDATRDGDEAMCRGGRKEKESCRSCSSVSRSYYTRSRLSYDTMTLALY